MNPGSRLLWKWEYICYYTIGLLASRDGVASTVGLAGGVWGPQGSQGLRLALLGLEDLGRLGALKKPARQIKPTVNS